MIATRNIFNFSLMLFLLVYLVACKIRTSKSSDILVSNGYYIKEEEIPEVIPLATLELSEGYGQYGICTGSFISPNTVLTAAHCLEGKIGVVYDTKNIYFPDFQIVSKKYISKLEGVRDQGEDLALIVFKEVTANSFLDLALNQDLNAQLKATVAGFGLDEYLNEDDGYKRKNDTTFLKMEPSGSNGRKIICRMEVDESETEALESNGITAPGDSGGPIFSKNVIYGVASTGAVGSFETAHASLNSKFARQFLGEAVAKGVIIPGVEPVNTTELISLTDYSKTKQEISKRYLGVVKEFQSRLKKKYQEASGLNEKRSEKRVVAKANVVEKQKEKYFSEVLHEPVLKQLAKQMQDLVNYLAHQGSYNNLMLGLRVELVDRDIADESQSFRILNGLEIGLMYVHKSNLLPKGFQSSVPTFWTPSSILELSSKLNEVAKLDPTYNGTLGNVGVRVKSEGVDWNDKKKVCAPDFPVAETLQRNGVDAVICAKVLTRDLEMNPSDWRVRPAISFDASLELITPDGAAHSLDELSPGSPRKIIPQEQKGPPPV